MKRNLPLIAAVLLLLGGLAFLLYPTFSEYYNQQRSSKAVSYYTQEVASLTEIEHAKMMDSAKLYNENLHAEDMKLIDGAVFSTAYAQEMDVWNGMMGYINISKIDVLLPIYHGTSEDVLSTGVGHIEGSALPTGEIGNHTILTGHTGLPSAQLFTDLIKLEVGDTFELLILDQTFVYEVIGTQVVLPNEVSSLKPQEDKDLVTLVTCTPYGINSHRLLVQAQQVEIDEEQKNEIESNIVNNLGNQNITIRWDFIAFIGLILLLSSIFIMNCILIQMLKKRSRE